MPLNEFEAHARGMRRAIMKAIEDYARAHKAQFDWPAFEADTTVDLWDLSKEALFFGADVLPDLPQRSH